MEKPDRPADQPRPHTRMTSEATRDTTMNHGRWIRAEWTSFSFALSAHRRELLLLFAHKMCPDEGKCRERREAKTSRLSHVPVYQVPLTRHNTSLPRTAHSLVVGSFPTLGAYSPRGSQFRRAIIDRLWAF